MSLAEPRHRLAVRPSTVKAALAYCRRHHRRLPRLQGGMWALAVLDRRRGPECDGCGHVTVWEPTLDDPHRYRCVNCGNLLGVPATHADQLVGVAVVGRPTARLLDDGRRLQVLRVAVLEGLTGVSGHANSACSMLYGAAARAARPMGASDLLTYTHADEPGTSLRAAGWVEHERADRPRRGGQWTRPARARGETAEPGAKVRWLAPWSALLRPGAGA